MNADGTLNAEQLNAMMKDITDAAAQLQQVAGSSPLGTATVPLMVALQKAIVEMTPPAPYFMTLGMQPHLNGVLQVAADLALFDLVPADSPMTSATIAEKTGADEALIVRLFRTMTAFGIFAEAGRRNYVHTKHSAVLKARPMRSLLKHWNTDTIPCSIRLSEYFKKHDYKNPEEAEESPCKDIHGHSFFDLMREYPERGNTFDDAMTSLNQGWDRNTSVFPYDTLASDAGTVAVVDVGGGRGHNSELIRDNFPELKDMKIIVQDLPNVIPTAENTKERMRPDLEYQAHDFFKPQPVKGARAYFFSFIFHDWSDEKCRTILNHTITAMDKSSKLLIRDFVLPDVGCPAPVTLLDINMMTISSMERDESDWRKLLSSCGLKWVKLHVEGGRDFMIEAELA